MVLICCQDLELYRRFILNNENLLKSISYLEFINNIDNLVFELLYAPQGGFTGLMSKNAVLNAKGFLDKFNYEAEKLRKQFDFDCADRIIEEKRSDLIKQMKKHYDKQTFVWADEVYQSMLNNCFLLASVFKDDKDVKDKIYARILSCVSWISEIRGLSEEQSGNLIELNLEKFYSAVNSKDSDFMPKADKNRSDDKVFIQLRDLILKDKDKFLQTDFVSLNDKLSQEDIKYFNRIKNDIQTFRINSVKDDILLVNSAIDVLKIKDAEKKYAFIKLIDNDFSDYTVQNNKKPDETNKIELVKRRMKLFKNSLQNDNISEYFKNKINS